MFDAFMCSTAVLANSEPPSARVVQDNNCGSCLPYENEETLRNTIRSWQENREVARKMGRNGRRLFEEQFSADRQAQNILEIYRQIGVC